MSRSRIEGVPFSRECMKEPVSFRVVFRHLVGGSGLEPAGGRKGVRERVRHSRESNFVVSRLSNIRDCRAPVG